MDPIDSVPGCDEHDGVRVVTTELPDSDDSQTPAVDVVHVMGIKTKLDFEAERLALSQIISPEVHSMKRELVFNIETAFLAHDLALTLGLVEGEARRLLTGLKHFRQSGSNAGAIAFVAYDLGALVVKKAICMAENEAEDSIWNDIVMRTVRFVFHGCFHRLLDNDRAVLTMLNFVQGGGNTLWSQQLTPRAIEQLVETTIELNEAFLDSEAIHRTRAFSLYAAESGSQRISKVFDWYTATLGIPTELAVCDDNEDGESQFPSLAEKICFAVSGWVREPTLAAVQSTLASVVPRPYQMLSTRETSSHPVLHSTSYQSWLRHSGVRILYIHGSGHAATIEAAEQVGLAWTALNQAQMRYEPRPFLFKFSAQDPAHIYVRHMLVASMLQRLAELSGFDLEDCIVAQVFEDLLEVQRTWTDKWLCTALRWAKTWFAYSGSSYILLDMDDCGPFSRQALWSSLADIAMRTEEDVKIVVTSKRPRYLLEELKRFPDIQVDEYNTPSSSEGSESLTNQELQDSMIQRFCPKRLGETRIRTCFEGLATMDRSTLESIMDLLSDATCWPEVLTSSNLARFCASLEDVSSESTVTTVVSRIFKSVDDQAGLHWILRWLLCGYRPFGIVEMATILCYERIGVETGRPPTQREVQNAKSDLKNILAGIASWRNGRVRILPDILSLMNRDDSGIWSSLRKSAPEATRAFLLEYLSLPHIQRRLDELYRRYRSRIESGDRLRTPSLVPSGQEDLIVYAVEALPHHLGSKHAPPISSDTVERMKDPIGPFSAWSRVYWAMDNPFSRPSTGPFNSAWTTWRSKYRSMQADTAGSFEFDADVETGHEVSQEDTVLSGMDRLMDAVRANDQESALRRAQQMVQHAEIISEALVPDPGPTIPWPSTALWIATWFDMHRLMSFLLCKGANVNDSTSKLSPSLIYMASRLGYSQMVALFLSHHADMTRLRHAKYSALYTAIRSGHVDVIKLLLAQGDDVLNLKQPCKPLEAASIHGCWMAMEILMQLPGANPDEQDTEGRTPLTYACSYGFIKTVRVLLDHDANPNIAGPERSLTALYNAAAVRGDTDIVRMLLARGAAINNEGSDATLLCDIVNNSTFSVEHRILLCEILIQYDPSINLDKAAGPNGHTPLMLAAENGDATIVKWLLVHGSNINLTNALGIDALYYAVAHGRIEATKELFKHDTSPSLETKVEDYGTLLQVAVADRKVKQDWDATLVEILLDAGADLESENNDKETVLSTAVVNHRTELVKLLLKRGADVNHRDKWEFTPVLFSILYHTSTDILRLLVDSGADLKAGLSDQSTALHMAMNQADLEKVRMLLEFHTSIELSSRNSHGETPLLMSTQWDRPQIVDCLKLLVRAGANVNEQDSEGWCLLMKSSWAANAASGVHEFLLSLPETDVNIVARTGGLPLQVAGRTGYMQLLQKLLDRGADVNKAVQGDAPTSLISTCMPHPSKKEETIESIVRKLVAHGAEPNFMSKNNVGLFNALCAASFGAGLGTIQFLLDSGASAHQPDPIGRLPLHFAAANGIRNFQAIITAYTGDIMAADNADKNVLHWAAQFGHVETIRAILERTPQAQRKSLVDCRDKDGWTPLAWAMRPTNYEAYVYEAFSEPQNYVCTVKYLLEQGADVSVTFEQGKGDESEVLTLAELATRCGADNLARLVSHAEDSESDNVRGSSVEEVSTFNHRRYTMWELDCMICRSTIYGSVYKCQTCPSVKFCKKCHSKIELYHMVDDGRLHVFGISDTEAEEFVVPKSPSLKASSRPQEPTDGTDAKTQRERVDTGVLEVGDDNAEDDVTEVVDFSDLKDLGSFTDSD